MKRGEIWTLAGGPGHAGKPRPIVIVQSDDFDPIASITFCPFTTNAADAPLLRIAVEPTEHNGLRSRSALMVDKVGTVRKNKLGSRIGRLEDEVLVRLNRALLVFFGLVTSKSGTDPE